MVMPRSLSMSMVSRIWFRKKPVLHQPHVLDKTVGQGRFTVVDMGDNTEIANLLHKFVRVAAAPSFHTSCICPKHKRC